MVFDPSLNVNDDYDGKNFGWDFFTCSSFEAKKDYLSAMFNQNFSDSLPSSIVKCISDSLNLNFNDGYGIDHQSLYHIPYEYGTKIPSLVVMITMMRNILFTIKVKPFLLMVIIQTKKE